MFNYKSYIRMARLVPEWSSERDKKTPDLVSAIRAAISRLLYTSSVRRPYIQIIIHEFYLETSSITLGLATSSTSFSLPDLWPKYFFFLLTSNHLFTPYKMYCSTLRAIDINGGSLAFVNNSHYWLVIKWCLTMFDYKSNIHMARLVPEWSSERDKKTLDLVSAIRAVIPGLLYTSPIWWPYIHIVI